RSVGRAGQAEFLAELVKAEAEVAVGQAVEQVGAGEVDVRTVGRVPDARRGDRGEGRVPAVEVDVDLGRQTHVLDFLGGGAVRVDVAAERLRAVGRSGDAVAAGAQPVDDGAGRADDDLAGDAAIFVTTGVVGDQADRGGVAGQDQQLAAGDPEVLVLVVGLGARTARGVDVVEAVTLARGDVEAAGDRVAQRA